MNLDSTLFKAILAQVALNPDQSRHDFNFPEVSIGHGLVCDALYLGLEQTIGRYLKELGVNREA